MIGIGIGSSPIGGDFFVASVALSPNIFLSGTLEYQSSFRIANRVSTYLNFTIITNDDNIVQVSLTNIIDGTSIDISGAQIEVSLYAPGTEAPAILMKDGVDITIGVGFFQFPLTHSNVENLTPGLYPWVAIITLSNGTRHTVNCGDIDQSTGFIKVVNRP